MREPRSVSEQLERLVPPFTDEPEEWEDVLRRTRGAGMNAGRGGVHAPRGRRRIRGRRALAVAGAAAFVAVVVGMPAFGIAARIVGLFSDEGKRVPLAEMTRYDRAVLASLCSKPRLVTPPGKAPETRCADGEPRVEEIADDGRRRHYRLMYPGGRVCVASGPARDRSDPLGPSGRFGLIRCTEGARAKRLVPSPGRPITVDAALTGRVRGGTIEVRLLRVEGLAGQGVIAVRLVDQGDRAVETAVRGRAYSFERVPPGEWVAIVAVGEGGDEVYREALPQVGPRRVHEFRAPRGARRPQPQPRPVPAPSVAPIQSGSAAGGRVDVYPSGLVIVRFAPDAAAYRKLARTQRGGRSLNAICADVAFGAGRWETLGGGAANKPLAPAVSFVVRGDGLPSPPFDACWVGGSYGRRWNTSHGMRSALEVGFTDRGRRYLVERAAARDLAYFVRSPELTAIRRSLKTGGAAPSGPEIARRFKTNRVRPLAFARQRTPVGVIGVWSDGKSVIEVSERAADGRRLFVRLRGGRIATHNLHALAFVF